VSEETYIDILKDRIALLEERGDLMIQVLASIEFNTDHLDEKIAILSNCAVGVKRGSENALLTLEKLEEK